MDCSDCLYFDKDEGGHFLSGGRCQLNPPIFLEGEWRQPRVMDTVWYKSGSREKERKGDWCSHCKDMDE